MHQQTYQMAIIQSWSGSQSCFVFGVPGSSYPTTPIILKGVVVSVKPSKQILGQCLSSNWTQAVVLLDLYSWSARFKSQLRYQTNQKFFMIFVSPFFKIPLKHIKLGHGRFLWRPSQFIHDHPIIRWMISPNRTLPNKLVTNKPSDSSQLKAYSYSSVS
jgi:hypothetical protein